jgi:hypothetical protein
MVALNQPVSLGLFFFPRFFSENTGKSSIPRICSIPVTKNLRSSTCFLGKDRLFPNKSTGLRGKFQNKRALSLMRVSHFLSSRVCRQSLSLSLLTRLTLSSADRMEALVWRRPRRRCLAAWRQTGDPDGDAWRHGGTPRALGLERRGGALRDPGEEQLLARA